MAGTRDCGADAAAYVLGALDPPAAEAFRRHLAGCSVCQDEVAAFREVAAALPMSAPQLRAPRGLRKRVMQSVRAQPRPGVARLQPRRVPPWLMARPRLVPVGATAAVLAILAAGVVVLGSGASSSRLVSANVAVTGASAQLRVAAGRGELIVRHFPAPAAGHVYEVWLKRSQQAPTPTSALFSVTSSGAAEVGIPGNLRGVQQVLVTEEADGGSPVPTRPPLIAARL